MILRTSRRHSSAVDDYVNNFSKYFSNRTSPKLKKWKMNSPISIASADRKKIATVGHTARLVRHHISVPGCVIMSRRQVFDKSHEYSYFDNYNLQ